MTTQTQKPPQTHAQPVQNIAPYLNPALYNPVTAPYAVGGQVLQNVLPTAGYTMPNQTIPEGQLEIAKTPLGSFTIPKNYMINTSMMLGGGLLIILGIAGMIWANRGTIEKTAATATKAAAVL